MRIGRTLSRPPAVRRAVVCVLATMPPKIRHESEVNRVISVMGVEVSHLLYEKYSFSEMFSSYTSQNTINLTNLLNFERDRQDKKDYETKSI